MMVPTPQGARWCLALLCASGDYSSCGHVQARELEQASDDSWIGAKGLMRVLSAE